MIKALEALCYLDDIANGRKMSLDPHKLKLIVEKELKALEIIKKLFEANVLGILKTNDSRYFLRVFCKAYEIDKEEYEILEEVLEVKK